MGQGPFDSFNQLMCNTCVLGSTVSQKKRLNFETV